MLYTKRSKKKARTQRKGYISASRVMMSYFDYLPWECSWSEGMAKKDAGPYQYCIDSGEQISFALARRSFCFATREGKQNNKTKHAALHTKSREI